jgi:hypothetical protein
MRTTINVHFRKIPTATHNHFATDWREHPFGTLELSDEESSLSIFFDNSEHARRFALAWQADAKEIRDEEAAKIAHAVKQGEAAKLMEIA